MTKALVSKVPELVVLYDEGLDSFRDLEELQQAVQDLKTIVREFSDVYTFSRYVNEWPPSEILLAMRRKDLPVNKLYRLLKEIFSGCGFSICGICEMEIQHEPRHFTAIKLPSTYRIAPLH